MKLDYYTIHDSIYTVRPALRTREWMDQTPDKFAYRCLPMTIANANGWEVLCPTGIMVTWDGGAGREAMKVAFQETGHPFASSHFGSGILTMHINGLIRTEPGYDLFVGGPINSPKHGISALSGIVETSWLAFTFTMNWKFTAPGRIWFQKDEPFCHFFPVASGLVQSVDPVIQPLTNNPELHEEYKLYSGSRRDFIEKSRAKDEDVLKRKWQRHYFQGRDIHGEPTEEDHLTKLRVKEFHEP